MISESDEVKGSLTHKISIGLYPVGSWLPSCRTLAAELGINRNTANKVYKDLADQSLTEVVPGKGYRVVKRPERGTPSSPNMMRARLVGAARDAKLGGMDRDAFIRSVVEIADMLYRHQRPLIAFVECNMDDATLLANELTAALSEPVKPLVLADLERSPEDVAASYDIICTTLYHLAQVRRSMGSAEDKVVAVHAPPDSQALLELARLDSETRVGVVCEQAPTRKHMAAAIGTVFDSDVRICLLSERDVLQEIGRSVDVLVDVPCCHEKITALVPFIRTITVGFHLDVNSLSSLRARLAELYSKQARDLVTASTSHPGLLESAYVRG